jgi:hypothetical protein
LKTVEIILCVETQLFLIFEIETFESGLGWVKKCIKNVETNPDLYVKNQVILRERERERERETERDR